MLDPRLEMVTITLDESDGVERLSINYEGISHFEALGLLRAAHSYTDQVVEGVIANMLPDFFSTSDEEENE